MPGADCPGSRHFIQALQITASVEMSFWIHPTTHTTQQKLKVMDLQVCVESRKLVYMGQSRFAAACAKRACAGHDHLIMLQAPRHLNFMEACISPMAEQSAS